MNYKNKKFMMLVYFVFLSISSIGLGSCILNEVHGEGGGCLADIDCKEGFRCVSLFCTNYTNIHFQKIEENNVSQLKTLSNMFEFTFDYNYGSNNKDYSNSGSNQTQNENIEQTNEKEKKDNTIIWNCNCKGTTGSKLPIKFNSKNYWIAPRISANSCQGHFLKKYGARCDYCKCDSSDNVEFRVITQGLNNQPSIKTNWVKLPPN